jgi:hypothetical protein
VQASFDTVPLAFGFINTGSVCHLLAVLVAFFSIGPFAREILRERAMVHDTRTLRGESVVVGLGLVRVLRYLLMCGNETLPDRLSCPNTHTPSRMGHYPREEVLKGPLPDFYAGSGYNDRMCIILGSIFANRFVKLSIQTRSRSPDIST